MKKQVLVSLILAGSLVSSFAHAEEKKETTQTSNSSSVKVTDVQKKDEQVKDIDDEITNARLRAQLGSKSRWSFKSDFGFNGGSIQKPFDAIRPNYRAGAQVESLAGLSGNVGVNYRLTEKDNLSAGTGITIMDPFHGDVTKPVEDPRKGRVDTVSRYQVSTPYLDWSRGYKAFGLQQVSSVTYSHYTDSDSSDIKALGNIALSQTFLGDFGSSNFSGGVNVAFDMTPYTGDPTSAVIADFQAGNAMRDDMGLGLFPFAEYSINDKFSLRTVFGYFQFIHFKDEYGNTQEWKQREPYQSVGVGMSITRDIYIYPNVQFTPKDIRADRTNVALSANINLF